MENRRQKCDPTTTKSMNRRHWKEFSSTHYINVAAIIPGWTWHPTLKYAFLISFFVNVFSVWVQGSEEATTALPVLQLTVRKHQWGDKVWQLCLWDNGESTYASVFLTVSAALFWSTKLFVPLPCTPLILSPNAHHYWNLSLKPGLSVSC